MSDIRWFHSEMAGISKTDNTSGSLINVLNACLIDGFALENIDTLTLSGGVATATIASGHDYRVDQYINISGATEAEYNGDWVVTAVSATTFNFEMTTTPASPATGTITSKVAPVGGWVKEYEDAPAFKVVYKSTEVGKPQMKFRLQEDGTRNSATVVRVDMHENMTDIDTGDSTSLNASKSITKHYTNPVSSPDAGEWFIVADKEFVHIFITHSNQTAASNNRPFTQFGFGNYHSYLNGDGYNSLISGNAYNNSSNTNTKPNLSAQLFYGARGADQATKNKLIRSTLTRTVQGAVSSNIYLGAYNAVDGRVFFDKVYLYESAPDLIRGEYPGTYFVSDRQKLGFDVGEIVEGTGSELGKKFIIIPDNISGSTNGLGTTNGLCLAVQINGSWRD